MAQVSQLSIGISVAWTGDDSGLLTAELLDWLYTNLFAHRDLFVEELFHLEDYEFGVVRVDRVSLKKSVLTKSGPNYSTLTESKPPTDI